MREPVPVEFPDLRLLFDESDAVPPLPDPPLPSSRRFSVRHAGDFRLLLDA